MADVEVQVKIGSLEFRAKGPQDWVADQLRFVVSVSDRGAKQMTGSSDTLQAQLREPNIEFPLGERASSSLAKHGLVLSELQSVFHRVNDHYELISTDIPGRSNAEKVKNVYLLMGIRQLLQSDSLVFADAEARETCKRLGCYDPTNHSKYAKRFGNEFYPRGDSFELTGPGQELAARLLKQMIRQTSAENDRH